MSLVKFYRGSANVSLPAHNEGSIFVITRDDSHGDIYVDVEEGKRLHIIPDSPITYLTAPISNQLRSEVGKVYYIDNGAGKDPSFKVGDGNAYVVDLPIFTAVTAEEKAFWNHKVDAYIQSEIIDGGSNEVLVLTRDNYLI